MVKKLASPAVYFIRRPTDIEAIPKTRPAIAVAGTDDNFNDFGHHFAVTATLLAADGTVESVGIRIMPEHGLDVTAQLDAVIPKGGFRTADQLDFRWWALFGDEDSYAKLVKLFGYDEARKVLATLRDIVFLNAEGQSDLAGVVTDPRFWLGVVRTYSAHRARMRGARFLSPARPRWNKVSSWFAVETQMHRRGRSVETVFDFESDQFLRDRMAVLIGPNGVGKTTIFARLIDAFRTDRDAARQGNASKFRLARKDELTQTALPHFNRLIVLACTPADVYPRSIAPWDGPDYHYASTTPQPAGETNKVTMALVDILRDRERLFPSLSAKGKLRRRELLATIVPDSIWDNLRLPLREDADPVQGASRVDGQYAVPISELTGEQKILLAFAGTDFKSAPVHTHGTSRRRLSSGELSLFNLAVQLVATVEPGSLLLVDEPETHLHPRFISGAIELLDQLLKATQSLAIIATHSPFVVREIPRNRVQILVEKSLKTSKGTRTVLQARRPYLQTFGASIDDIGRVVFEDDDVEHLHDRLIARWLETTARRRDLQTILADVGDELNPETLTFIAEYFADRGDGEDA